METHPGEGVMKEKYPNTRKPSHRWVCGEFWKLRGQHNLEQKKKKITDYPPNHNSQRSSSPDAPVCQQRMGAEQGGPGYMFRARTGPECPEDNLRELT